MDDEDLRQADLSHLRLAEMSEAQRAELRRRYQDFIRRLAPPTPPRRVRTALGAKKWVPGKRVR